MTEGGSTSGVRSVAIFEHLTTAVYGDEVILTTCFSQEYH